MENLIKKIWAFIKSRSPYVIVISVLVVILVLQQQCNHTPVSKKPKTEIIVIRDTIRDTTLITSTVYVPTIREIVRVDTIPADVDTAEILADYFSEYYYTDTLMNDTVALLIMYDEVSQNKIMARSWQYRNRRPVEMSTTFTTVINPPTWNIGFGLFTGGNFKRFDAGVGIIVSTKKNFVYEAQYSVFDKSFRVGCYWNIRRSK